MQHEVLSLSSDSDSYCSDSNTLPRSINCQTSDEVIDKRVNTLESNIGEESLPVQSLVNDEILLEASYPEFTPKYSIRITMKRKK